MRLVARSPERAWPIVESQMNVTYLNPTAGLGGAERCLLDMLLGCQRAGSGVRASVVLLEAGPLVAAVRALGVRCEVIELPHAIASVGESSTGSIGRLAASVATAPATAPEVARFLRVLRSCIADTSPSVIHSNGLKTHLLARWVCPTQVPVICHLHDFIGSRLISSHAIVPAATEQTYYIANSRAVAVDAARVLGSGDRVRCIHNGVDTTLFSPQKIDASWLDLAADAPAATSETVRVGLVGTYARWKGQDVFIDAVGLLPETVRARARFYIIGGPIYATAGSQWSQAELQKRALGAGVRADVLFVPFQQDPAHVMRSLDCLVHASTQPEPFGRTIIEGMACGKPVIVAAAGGAAELFSDGVDALGVPGGHPRMLANAMMSLIESSTLRRRIGTAGRETAIRVFRIELFQRKIIETYCALQGQQN